MAGMAHDAVLGELEQGPLSAALRLKIEARGEGNVTVRMPFGEHLLNAGGPGVPIHGGAIAALADFAACAAVWTMPETRSSATISMTVNYTAPAVENRSGRAGPGAPRRQTYRQHRGRNSRPARRARRRRAGHLQNCLTRHSTYSPRFARPPRCHGLNLVAAIPLARYDRAVAARRARVANRSGCALDRGASATAAAISGRRSAHAGAQSRMAGARKSARRLHPRGDRARSRRAAPRCRGSDTPSFIRSCTAAPGRSTSSSWARLAGIGGPSILGVVVHPIYGPWIAFRAALLIDVSWMCRAPRTASIRVPDASPQLHQRVSGRRSEFPAGWDVPKCLTHRVEVEPDCAGDATRESDACSARSIAIPTTSSRIIRCARCARCARTTRCTSNPRCADHRGRLLIAAVSRRRWRSR